ncbi:MAG: hypothetical protein GXO79_07580 [Chlorobi bacterium]|nr:hypothetical protein [Chlorobiota bacterium]
MKTKNINIRIAKKIFIALLIVLTVNVFANKKNNSKTTNTKKNVTTSLYKNKEKEAPSSNLKWMNEEIEKELIVEDITENYTSALWNIEACEPELTVEEYKPTEELIPAWMNIEIEPELEVTNLTIE